MVSYFNFMGIVQKLLREKDHAGIQFFKYVACGGLAFVTDFCVFYLMAVFVVPSLTQDDVFARLLGIVVEPVTEAMRLRNFWIGKSTSFVASNLVAYALNVMFVFKGGKHKVHHEMALFFGVSFVAFLLGTWSGGILIHSFGIQTTFSNLTAIVFATLINYTGRKFFIFHG